mgnify:CR=1 FL=1
MCSVLAQALASGDYDTGGVENPEHWLPIKEAIDSNNVEESFCAISTTLDRYWSA